MFSVITNICNKKTKGPTLMELFTAIGKLEKFFFFFLTTRDVWCVHHGWHGTHQYHIQVLATRASINMSASIFFTAAMILVNCLYHARMVLFVGESFAHFAQNALCTVTTDLLVLYSDTQNDFSPGVAIFSLHTLASSSGRNMIYDENNLLGKIFLSCSFCLYRFCNYVSYGFPIINFCNPGVHYEMPCRIVVILYTICLNTTGSSRSSVTALEMKRCFNSDTTIWILAATKTHNLIYPWDTLC